MKILNLTQHAATPSQISDGVVDFSPEIQKEIMDLLTFEEPPTEITLRARASELAELARLHADGATHCMIGGAQFFLAPLVAALKGVGMTPMYAFSQREQSEQPQPDGTTRKVVVFKHAGWVPAI